MESIFLVILQKWGPAAVSVLLIFVVSFLIREIKKNSEDDKHRMTKLHNDITKMRDDVNNSLNGFGERLTRVEHEYVKKDTFLNELSGWRTEINRLYDLFNTNFISFTQNIIQILTQGKK